MQKDKKTIIGTGLAAMLFSLIAFKLVEFSIFGGLVSFGDVELNINIGTAKSETSFSTHKSDGKEQNITGEAQQICENKKPDYACKRITLLLAERNLAEKVEVEITAQNTLENGELSQDIIHSQTQAIISKRTIIFENYDAENNLYTYRLQATVISQ